MTTPKKNEKEQKPALENAKAKAYDIIRLIDKTNDTMQHLQRGLAAQNRIIDELEKGAAK